MMGGAGSEPTREWSSRSAASRFKHQIFYVAIRLGGRPAAYAMLFFVVLWYTALPSVRARSAAYLRRRFPGSGTLAALVHAFRLNLAFGYSLVDRAVAGITGDFCVQASDADKRATLDLLAEGKGLILLTAHVGNWQAALSAMDFTPAPKAVVMHRSDRDVDKHYYEHGGDGPPFSIIDPAAPLGGTIEMMDALRRGAMLCGMGDRHFGNADNIIPVPFLGAPIRVPFSFYRIAAATGAPIAVAFTRRTGPGRAEIELADVIRIPSDLGRSPGAYPPYAERFAKALENYVNDNPYQYYNFYNIWKEQ